VFIADLDSSGKLSNVTPLPQTENDGFFRVWAWSPDGKRLAGNFDSAHGPGMGFYDMEKNKYVRIGDFPLIPRWMPDGRRLIFVRNRRPAIADTETNKIRDILREIKDDMRNVGVSPDGKKLFYTTFESESDIWLLDISGIN
jgi:Tol biopolymer transport system component